jgi:hypothetical protein
MEGYIQGVIQSNKEESAEEYYGYNAYDTI